jgi:hypothetical protein
MYTLSLHDALPICQARAFIVPLANHMFNQCKSNIAWFEATYAGAACVAPGYMPEFNKPGVLTYNSIDEFKDIMRKIMSKEIDVNAKVRESETYIMTNYNLQDMNKKRVDLFKALMH